MPHEAPGTGNRKTEVVGRGPSVSARRTALLLGLPLMVGAGKTAFAYALAHPRPRFATAVVNHGDSQSTISATEKLSTVVSIEVGTQVSGSSHAGSGDLSARSQTSHP